MCFNIDANIRAVVATPHNTMRCQNKENSQLVSSAVCRPYFQLPHALAAVYFVNGLFQLSLSVARVRLDPPESRNIEICSFFLKSLGPKPAGIEKRKHFDLSQSCKMIFLFCFVLFFLSTS